MSNVLYVFVPISCLIQTGVVMTRWKAFKAIQRGILDCHSEMEARVAGNQGYSWKVKGTPAQQRIVLPNMPMALALSNRTAYSIPTPTKLLRYLSLHSPKVQNKLRSSRWHWPSLDSFSLFIRPAYTHTDSKRKKNVLSLDCTAFTLKTQPQLAAEALLHEMCFAAHRAHKGLKEPWAAFHSLKEKQEWYAVTSLLPACWIPSPPSFLSLTDFSWPTNKG